MSMQPPSLSYPKANFVQESESGSQRGLGRKLSARTLNHLQTAEQEIASAAGKSTTDEMQDHFARAHHQAAQICTEEDKDVLRENGFLRPVGLRVSPHGATVMEGFDRGRYVSFLMELPTQKDGNNEDGEKLTSQGKALKDRVDKARQHLFISDFVRDTINEKLVPAWEQVWNARHPQHQSQEHAGVEADRASNSSKQSRSRTRDSRRDQDAPTSNAAPPSAKHRHRHQIRKWLKACITGSD